MVNSKYLKSLKSDWPKLFFGRSDINYSSRVLKLFGRSFHQSDHKKEK